MTDPTDASPGSVTDSATDSATGSATGGPDPRRAGAVALPDLTPAPRPATPAARVRAQAGLDARVMLRNGEQVLLTLILPALLLVVLVHLGVPDLGDRPRVDVLAPGVLALAVLSTAFTGQAIGTAFDRRHGVLRLLATTPLGRGGLLAGRVLAVLAVQVVQVVVLTALALGLRWRPDPTGVGWALLAGALGTAAFVALGLLLAGTLRAEAVLAGANLVWVALVAGGGVVLPATLLGGFAPVARLLPSGALGDALRAALLDGRGDLVALLVLAAWAMLAGAAVARLFRWD